MAPAELRSSGLPPSPAGASSSGLLRGSPSGSRSSPLLHSAGSPGGSPGKAASDVAWRVQPLWAHSRALAAATERRGTPPSGVPEWYLGSLPPMTPSRSSAALLRREPPSLAEHPVGDMDCSLKDFCCSLPPVRPPEARTPAHASSAGLRGGLESSLWTSEGSSLVFSPKERTAAAFASEATAALTLSEGSEPPPSSSPDSAGPQHVQRADVEWLLSSAGREDQEEWEQHSFLEEARRKFRALQGRRPGLLSLEDLSSRPLPELFPGTQLELVEGERHIQALTSSVPHLMAAFDWDLDACLNEEEFLRLAKFCHAWRLRQGQLSPERRSCRPPALPRKGTASGSRRAAAASLPSRLPTSSTLSAPSAASRQSSVSVDSSPGPSRPPSEQRQGALAALSPPKHRGRSRPTSQASSRPSSRASGSSDGSRRGASKLERLSSGRQEALKALAHYTLLRDKTATLPDLVHGLLQHCITRDHMPAFSRELVERVCERVEAEIAAGWIVEEVAEPAPSRPASASPPKPGSSLRREPAEAEEPLPFSPGAAVAAVQRLVAECGLAVDDVMGQVLFRNRRAEPMQGVQFRATVEDMSWVQGHQALKEVFRSCTHMDHGRMRRDVWLKIVHLIQRNPVLRTRVRHSDADRLFHSLVTRSKDPQRSIGYQEFLQLLVMLVETSGLHPWMIFLSVGANAARIAAVQPGWDPGEA